MSLQFGLLGQERKRREGVIDTRAFKITETQVKEDSGAPDEQHPEGAMIINTAENRVYVRTKGSADAPDVAHYKLNESSGTTASDTSGSANVHDGTATTSANWVSAKYDNGFDTTDSDDIEITGHADFDFNGDFTVEFWMKADTIADNEFMVIRQNPASTRHWNVGFTGSTGIVRCQVRGSSGSQTLDSITKIQTGAYVHIAFTFDDSATTGRIYIDGVLDASDATMSPGTVDFDTTDNVFIGAQDGGVGRFDGIIDDVKVWKSLRTETQVNSDLLDGTGLVWTYARLQTA